MSREKEKKLNRKYFIIDVTRALSSNNFSSDTTRGHLNVKNVNNKLIKKGWYEKCWLDKGGGRKWIKPPWVTPETSPRRCKECLGLFTQRWVIKQNMNCLKDIKMSFSPYSVQNNKALIIIIGRTALKCSQTAT